VLGSFIKAPQTLRERGAALCSSCGVAFLGAVLAEHDEPRFCADCLDHVRKWDFSDLFDDLGGSD
jgi:hypothetical protein